MNWDDFLAPYKQAVEELKVKLRGMRAQFEREEVHSPIEFVTGRVKPVASILDKAESKAIPLEKVGEELQDIAGLRMMCQFVDDIKLVVHLLRMRNDFEIVEERDYISNKKNSGYRSYHVVIKYPVQPEDVSLLSQILETFKNWFQEVMDFFKGLFKF